MGKPARFPKKTIGIARRAMLPLPTVTEGWLSPV